MTRSLPGKETVCDKIQKLSARGAQTSRPDDAGPVRDLRGGLASPAASFDIPLLLQLND
jgi:hypothetical protein